MEEMQHNRRGKDGDLPGGREHPSRRKGRAKCDEGIKYPETNCASQNPKMPMLDEYILDIYQCFPPLCHQNDDDQEHEHIPEPQTRRPDPITASQTHCAVENEGAAKE